MNNRTSRPRALFVGMTTLLLLPVSTPQNSSGQSVTPDPGATVEPCVASGPDAVPTTTEGGLAAGPHTIIVDGVRLWYCVAGEAPQDAPPVVFLHGGPGQGSHHFAALLGPRLEPALRMVYFDQRGSGRSERPWDDRYSMDRLVDDIEALRLALSVPRIALIGHSFGATLALEYAARYPDHVSRMALVGGLSDVQASLRSQCRRLAELHPEAYERAIEAAPASAGEAGTCDVFGALEGEERERFFTDNMFPDPAVEERLDSLVEASGLRNTGEVGRALFSSGLMEWRFTDHQRLTMPVLVIAGKHDYQVGLEAQRALAEALPDGRLLVYEQSGHFSYLDEPDRFARDVIDFFGGR